MITAKFFSLLLKRKKKKRGTMLKCRDFLCYMMEHPQQTSWWYSLWKVSALIRELLVNIFSPSSLVIIPVCAHLGSFRNACWTELLGRTSAFPALSFPPSYEYVLGALSPAAINTVLGTYGKWNELFIQWSLGMLPTKGAGWVISKCSSPLLCNSTSGTKVF